MDNSMDIKKDFPVLNQSINDEPYIYLDSAASSFVPLPVQEKITTFLNTTYANVHRGVYTTAYQATQEYEKVRDIVKNFIHAASEKDIIFTSGTTDSLNIVAKSYGESILQEQDEIFVSALEHHANLVPWQELAKKTGAKLIFMPLLETGEVDVKAVSKMATHRTKIVAVTHVSNVLGVHNDIETLANIVHNVGGVIVVDGAQSTPHLSVDVTHYDFYAFSGHKLGALNGIGVLYGRHELLEKMPPITFGGDMIEYVGDMESTYQKTPYKFEAGTPNIIGAISLGAAIEYIQQCDMDTIRQYTQQLTMAALHQLQTIPDVLIYGHEKGYNGGSIISFNLKGIHPHDVATALDMEGVAVRAGHHCAQPLMRQLNVTATVRASFYIYNTKEDVDRFVEAVKKVKEFFTNGRIDEIR
ncbi:SufS family cysteine desulfurase [Carnobacteriaceae bacterium zg-ZUI78]|nr:SufS family cysteine desulfurase [Carnobacteriaceae bacterium zg-ZUI78]